MSVTHYREADVGANIVMACGTPAIKAVAFSADKAKVTCLRCSGTVRYKMGALGMTYEQARKHVYHRDY